MKAIILYAAKHGAGCAGPFWPVYISGAENSESLPVFIRAESVEAEDLSHALSLATPKSDEIVLNAIELA